MKTYFLHSNEPNLKPLLAKLELSYGTLCPRSHEGTIIQWSKSPRELPGRDIIQSAESIALALNKKKVTESLRIHGIKTLAGVKETFPYKFIVPVFNLEVLALFQKKEKMFLANSISSNQKEVGQFEEMDLSDQSYYVKRVKKEAVKAVYALGLDYGLVHAAITSKGHTLILDVEPIPELNRRLTELFAEAINRYAAEAEAQAQAASAKPRKPVLGADPEFVLRSERGTIVFASKFMGKEGRAGCDSIVLSDQRKLYALAELRPEPSSEPAVLLRNLRSAMRLAAAKITDPSLAWLAGGMPLKGFPLGGHIHISGIPLSVQLLRTLDNYLALPLAMLEDSTTASRRPKYGGLGDFRRQPHGGFEYRTLPSWLVSPEVTRGVFALARVIAGSYERLRLRPLNSTEVQRAYFESRKDLLATHVRLLWEDLESLEIYETYRTELDTLKEMILAQRAWDEQQDIRKAWKIPPFDKKTNADAPFHAIMDR